MRSRNFFRSCMALPLFLAASMSAANASADVVVVVSVKSAIASLTAVQVTKIFLGKTNVFPNGDKADPVDQAEGSTIRDEFYSRVLNKSPSQISAYWAKTIFTGDGYPPKLLESNEAVKRAVAGSPNAIGYINKSAVDSSVRIILAP